MVGENPNPHWFGFSYANTELGLEILRKGDKSDGEEKSRTEIRKTIFLGGTLLAVGSGPGDFATLRAFCTLVPPCQGKKVSFVQARSGLVVRI